MSIIVGSIVADHPAWRYLLDSALPVRAATVEEAAVYAERMTGDEWAWLYRPDLSVPVEAPGWPLPDPVIPDATSVLPAADVHTIIISALEDGAA